MKMKPLANVGKRIRKRRPPHGVKKDAAPVGHELFKYIADRLELAYKAPSGIFSVTREELLELGKPRRDLLLKRAKASFKFVYEVDYEDKVYFSNDPTYDMRSRVERARNIDGVVPWPRQSSTFRV